MSQPVNLSINDLVSAAVLAYRQGIADAFAEIEEADAQATDSAPAPSGNCPFSGHPCPCEDDTVCPAVAPIAKLLSNSPTCAFLQKDR